MKSIQNQYIDLKEGKMSQTQFMRNVRLTMPHFITNTTSFNDTVKILKNKAILTESYSAQDIVKKYNEMFGKNPQTKFADVAKALNVPEDEVERAMMSVTPGGPGGLKLETEEIKVDGKVVKNYKQNGDKSYNVEFEDGSKKQIYVSHDDWDVINNASKSLNEVEDTEIAGSEPTSLKAELKKGIKIEMEHTDDPKVAAKIAMDHLKENPKYYSDLENSGVDTASGLKSNVANDITANNDEFHRDGFGMGFFEEGTEEQVNEAKEIKGSSAKDQYKNFKEIDNLNAHEVLIGLDWEMENDHSLTKEKASKIVIKKLKKDPFYYTHWDLAGKEDMDVETTDSVKPEVNKMKPYTDKTKTDKGMAMKPVKGIEKIKASANKAKKETNKLVKGVKELTHVAKRAKGVKGVMAPTGGKMKKIKEGLLNEAGGEYTFNGTLNKKELEELDRILSYTGQYKIETDEVDDHYETTIYHTFYNELNLRDAVKQATGQTTPSKDKLDLGSSFDKFKSKLKEIVQEVLDEYYYDGRDNLAATDDINEMKVGNIQQGQEFTLSDDLGNFSKGEKVTVDSVEEDGADIRIVLVNEEGIKDDFYLDPNDDIELV